MSNKIAINIIKNEIHALHGLLQTIDEKFDKAIDMINSCLSKVVILGVGKSGHIGKKIAATMSSLGTPTFFVHMCEGMHGDLGMISADDVCIIFSYSGETEEILPTIQSIRQIGPQIIGISGNPESTLAKECVMHLDICVRSEADPMCLAPTSSSTAMLVLGDALAVSLAQKKGFTKEDFKNIHPGGNLGEQLKNHKL
jgi:arabinose-5-phosphate isomerase